MPDLSHDDIHANAPLAVASERQIWNSLSPEGRAQILGQSIAGESNISNKESVYQKDPKIRSYESMDYSSLPSTVQYDVSHILHEMGYFKETYGATVYEVDGDNRYECKDCEEPFVSEEDLRVHRKVNHDNEESESEGQEAYNYSLDIDPSITKENLGWARKVIRGESSRVSFPQNDPPTPMTPKLPKGRKEYDDNPNHYFYDSKLFRRGSRGSYTGQDGVALTEAKHLINLEGEILEKYGWESTKEIEKNKVNREVFASEVAKVVNVENLHPRTIKIIDSVNKPFLVNTLQSLGANWAKEADGEDRGDIAPFIEEEPVLHQDYDPEHPHEHNAFDQNFGDKVAEEQEEETVSDIVADNTGKDDEERGEDSPDYSEEGDFWQDKTNYEVDVDELQKTGEPVAKLPTDKRADEQEEGDRTCPTCGYYSADEQELHSHVQDHKDEPEAQEDFPFEDQEERTTVTAEPDLLQNVNTDALQVESEEYNPDEEYDQKAEEARILQQYTGYKPKAGEALDNIMDGAIDTPLEQLTVNETIYDRKLDGYHEDKIARELNVYHDIEYEDAIEKIRSIEVNDNDRTAKTLFGKKFADCNESEVSEMKILGGEAKGKKHDRR